MSQTGFDALIIGGGINGLSALYHLTAGGTGGPVGLVERFRLGHDRGSSHGHSRVTRTAYVDAGYVRLMRRAHAEAWPRLERDAGRRLVHRTRGCFYGPPGGKWERYARAVAAADVDCEVIDVDEARRRYPMFRFAGAAGAVDDGTAGLIAAAETLVCLEGLARTRGARILEETRVLGIDVGADPIAVDTERGRLTAERLVVAAGPWTARLLPWLAPRLRVARQTVGYFALEGDPAQHGIGRFPVWGNLGADANEVYYGLPAYGRDGIKVARHVTAGRDDDPEEPPAAAPPAEVEGLRAFLAAQFTAPVARLLAAEACLYTNTATEDFVIDLHPDNPRVAIAAGFSGHGFKFGPVTGRALVELVTDGRTSMPEFEAMRPTFAAAPCG